MRIVRMRCAIAMMVHVRERYSWVSMAVATHLVECLLEGLLARSVHC